MGMYTEMYLGLALVEDMPKELIRWFKLQNDITEENYEEIEAVAPMELKGTRLQILNGGSYYFDSISHYRFEHDTISEDYRLVVGFNIKNYNQEIEKFLVIIQKYIATAQGEHIGHIRYEEDIIPTILYSEKADV